MKFAAIATWAVIALAGAVVVAQPANAATVAAPPVSSSTVPAGTLDPATYSGSLVVATPSGDVLVQVNAGEASTVAHGIQAAVAGGAPAEVGAKITVSSGSAQKVGTVMSPAAVASCGGSQNSVAGPGVYWTSVQGCAVFGYTGYVRNYSWSNNSDVTICAKGNGYNSSFAQFWYSVGCRAGGASNTIGVPWGNVLAYTQMQGLSTSVVTGAGYSWSP